MLSPSLRSALLLTATLAAGVLLGIVGSGRLAQRQRDRARELRRPPGFVAHVERVIAPRDEAQRAAIHPILEAAARRNEQITRAANDQLRAGADSMRARLAPLLDAAQRTRLEREFAAPRPGFGPGGPGGRPPPPDGRAGPPPFGGPPPR